MSHYEHTTQKALELSGHGVPAIAAPLAVLFSSLPDTDENYALVANFLVGILTDIVWSVILKPLVRRTRPFWQSQHQLATVEHIDQYSFPSGHSSRATYEAAFLYGLASAGVIPKWVGRAAAVWAGTVCASRVALGRHFVGDVLAGSMVGLVNYRLVHAAWLSPAAVMAARGTVLSGLRQLTK